MAGFHFSNANANKKWPVYTTMICSSFCFLLFPVLLINRLNMPFYIVEKLSYQQVLLTPNKSF